MHPQAYLLLFAWPLDRGGLQGTTWCLWRSLCSLCSLCSLRSLCSLCTEVHRAEAHLLVCGRHAEREVQEDLDRGHDHSGVAVAEPVIQHIHDIVHLLLPGGAVMADKLQHLALCPLREVLHSRGQA